MCHRLSSGSKSMPLTMTLVWTWSRRVRTSRLAWGVVLRWGYGLIEFNTASDFGQGMLASGATVKIVAEALVARAAKVVVVDPVMVATSGAKLLPEEAL